jgi:hypothetical protein
VVGPGYGWASPAWRLVATLLLGSEITLYPKRLNFAGAWLGIWQLLVDVYCGCWHKYCQSGAFDPPVATESEWLFHLNKQISANGSPALKSGE